MSTTSVSMPTSRCRFGIGREDITPPVGVYHRFWGAAAHDEATGVHRPLTATVVTLQPLESGESSEPHVLIAVDHCLFRAEDMQRLREETAGTIGIDADRITFTFSHTHSAGNICRSRADLPGGEKIGPYLDSLPGKVAAAFQAARASQTPAILTYAAVTCDMGRHRDYLDEASGRYVCGFNPDEPLDLPLGFVRASDADGRLLASVVNYPCHPTTLAWENTLISPDYVGALRETVEATTSAPCLFLLAPCGDVGPRDGFVGETEVAERNGRQVGYAALAAIESMPAAATDYHYDGPVVSGATIGLWRYRPQTADRVEQTSVFRHRRCEVRLPYRKALPTCGQVQKELESFLTREREARAQGRDEEAADHRAMAERKRRLLERLLPLPAGKYPYSIELWQLGDAFWVAVEGEPYHGLQQELNRRFPGVPIIVVVLANGSRCSYLPTRTAYDKPLYEVEVAVLEAGCLERVTDEIAAQIGDWLAK